MNGISDETICALLRWSLENAQPRGAHITRFAMYRALSNCLRPYDATEKTGLTISLSTPFAQGVLGLRKTRLTDVSYPEHNMLELSFPDACFDFCVSDQVLEHIEGDPVTAFRESVRILKPGGFVCHTTCFVNEIHGAPGDFWRFTPNSLSLMARLCACKTVTVGGWGNREAWGVIRHGFRFEGIPLDEQHPLHRIATYNEADVPIVVWIVAQKESDGGGN